MRTEHAAQTGAGRARAGALPLSSAAIGPRGVHGGRRRATTMRGRPQAAAMPVDRCVGNTKILMKSTGERCAHDRLQGSIVSHDAGWDDPASENGGPSRNRTGVHGFAVRCVTTPPSGHPVWRSAPLTTESVGRNRGFACSVDFLAAVRINIVRGKRTSGCNRHFRLPRSSR